MPDVPRRIPGPRPWIIDYANQMEERPRVLIVVTAYPEADRPIESIFVKEQAEALASAFDVAVLVARVESWRCVFRRGWPRPSIRREGPLLVLRQRAYATRIGSPTPEHAVYPVYARIVERGIARLCRHWGVPDLIHAHFVLPAGWAAARAARNRRIPVLLTEHSAPFDVHLRTPLQRALVAETFAGMDRVLTVSPQLADRVGEWCEVDKIAPVGNLIRTDYFVPGPPVDQRPFRFLTVAILERRKGIHDLLEAAFRLRQMGNSPFEVVVAGDGPERAALESQCDELGVTDIVRFTGALGREGVLEEMRRCHAFVLPSYHETFGVVLGEAMACGKPVIATRCGGPEWFVGPENGILVPVGDPSALAAAMLELLEGRRRFDPDVVRRSIEERFGPAAFIQRMTEIYTDVLRSRASGRERG